MKKLICILVAALMTATLAACASNVQTPDAPAISDGDQTVVTAPASDNIQRADGECFSSFVSVEGEQVPVECKHFVSPLGYEIDYHYQEFEFTTGEGMDCYQWYLDNAEELPQNIMTVSSTPDDSETVASNTETMYGEYFDEVTRSTERAGDNDCVVLRCGGVKDNPIYSPDTLIDCYIVKAADGCRVVELKYTTESAEGVGARLYGMLESLRCN